MATATKRSVKRTAKQEKAKVAKENAKRNARVASLATIKSDAGVKASFAAYEKRERGAESMVMWVTDVVKLFADPKKNFGVDKSIAEYFVKEESKIRCATRRDKLQRVTKRDKTGVSASQFLGVLKLAKMSGGAKMWERITSVASNWSLSRELAAQVRGYHKDNDGTWPNDTTLEKMLAANKTSRRGKTTRTGGIKLGAPALSDRLLKDARDFKARLRKMMIATGSETLVQGLIRNAELLVRRVKDQAAKEEKAAKAAAKAA